MRSSAMWRRARLGVDLPEPGAYAAGNVFLPQNETERAHCKALLESLIERHGQTLLGFLNVDTAPDAADIGDSARASMPHIEQIFVARAEGMDRAAFERELFLIRKQASHQLRGDESLEERQMFYVCSLSPRVIVYKGMLTPEQVPAFYPDLVDPAFESHLAMFTRGFRPTPSPPGTAPSPTASCLTTARSTRCGVTRTGCTPVKERLRASSLAKT